MTSPTEPALPTLYDQDYYLWLQETIAQLGSKQFSRLDRENLIEELESMGRSDKRAIKSLLTRLIEHLLKLAYWTSERSYNQSGWKGEIRTFREQIKDLLQDSPSLNPYVEAIFKDCYQNARSVIIDVTALPADVFPVADFASLEQILDEDWLPTVDRSSLK